MNITIQFGYWLLPAFATLAAFGLPWWAQRNESPSYGADIGGVVLLLLSTIVSLCAWMVWALTVLWVSS